MTQQNNQDSISQQVVEMAFQALLAEYNAIREASLSRDERSGMFENFMMVILSAALVGLPTIIKEQQFFLIPVFSIILTATAFAHRSQRQLLRQLASYESEFLRTRLLELLYQSGKIEQYPKTITELWKWQSFYRGETKKISLFRRLLRRAIIVDIKSLFIFASLGFITLFIYYRGLVGLSLPELVLFCLASLYSISFVILSAYSFLKR